MKVKELIEHLSKLDHDLDVYTFDQDDGEIIEPEIIYNLTSNRIELK